MTFQMRTLCLVGTLLASAPTAAAMSAPSGSSFVGMTTDTGAYIAWTETVGGSLAGQFQITSVMSASQSSQGRLRLDSHNLSFTGVRSGQSISLTFSEFFFAKTLTGALKGRMLTLTVPGNEGLLSTVEMHEGTVEEHNRGVITLQKRVAQTNAAVDQLEAAVRARAAQREAVIRANTALQEAHYGLSVPLSILNAALGLRPSLILTGTPGPRCSGMMPNFAPTQRSGHSIVTN